MTTGIALVDSVIDAYIYAFGGTLFLALFVFGVFIYMAIKNDMDRTGLAFGFLLLFAMMTKVMFTPDWTMLVVGMIAMVGVYVFLDRKVF